jgi:hypothetical protein
VRRCKAANGLLGQQFDIVICNGVPHYFADTYTPVPDCHNNVPVSCDNEQGRECVNGGAG